MTQSYLDRAVTVVDQNGTPVLTSEGDYAAVAAGQTNATLGAAGAVGDFLGTLFLMPATSSPGAMTLKDGNTTVMTFAGGASSVSNLLPVPFVVNAYSKHGAWNVTTGANVSVLANGNFTEA